VSLSGRRLSRGSLVLLLALAGCDGDQKPAPPPATPESAATRPKGDGITPEMSAIVTREGDHLVVIVDVAPTDAQGRKVEKVAIEADGPEVAVRASPESRSADRVTVEARVPAGTRSVRVAGASEGGATWSATIRTDLAAR
jgi:hypothetical protein